MSWRDLQLSILDVARQLRRTLEQEQAACGQSSESRSALWAMLGDAFWMERDLARLECMIEEVLVELQNQVVSSSPR